MRRVTPVTRFITLALAAMVVLSIGAAACTSDSDSGSDGPAGSGGPLVIGSIVSLTGGGEAYGLGQSRGQRLAIDQLAGSIGPEVQVIEEDDGSVEAGGVAAMEALIGAEASVLLGPTLSPVAAAADPVAQSAGVPVLAVTNTTLDIDAIGDVVWRISLSEEAMIPAAVSAARAESGFQRAALVYDSTDGYAIGAAEAFRSAAAAQGFELVDDLGYVPGTGEGRAALEAIATGAGTGSGAGAGSGSGSGGPVDALLMAARGSAASELLLGAAGLDLPDVRVGGNGFNSSDVLAAAGPAAEGLIVAASWNIEVANPLSTRFVADYRAAHGTDPDAFAAQGYAAVQVLLAAVEAVDGAAAPADVLEGLGRVGTVETVLGPLRFEDREAFYPAAVQIVVDGAFQLL